MRSIASSTGAASPPWLQIVRMAFRALQRDGQSGELQVLIIALLLAVASHAAVGFFADRVQRAIERQANALLGADLFISSPNPIHPEFKEAAQREGLHTAETWSFRSVVIVGDQTQLIEVKAVSSSYPLRGTVQVSEALFAPAQAVHAIPGPGELWGDEWLLHSLGGAIGTTVRLGAREMRVTRILVEEPEWAGDWFDIAPRALMNLTDLPSTQLIQAGSRVNYRLLLAGEPTALAAFKTWAEPRLLQGTRLQGVRETQAELFAVLDRVERFLKLAALVSVVVAGAGIAMATRRFAQRHWDCVAILRCLGATEAFIVQMFGLELLVLAVLAGFAGLLAGYLAQYGLSGLLGELLHHTTLPSPSWGPAGSALAIGLITLLGFGVPFLLRLQEVPPVRVLRRDLGPINPRLLASYSPALGATAAVFIWQAGEWRLASYVGIGVAGTAMGLSLAAWGLIKALHSLRSRASISWRFGLINIARRGFYSVIQIVALGLGLMTLLVLTMVRADLLTSWQASLPLDAPNYFLINIQADQVAGIQAFLQERGQQGAVALFPMVRGRLTHLNDRAVGPEDYAGPHARRLIAREFNLSWMERLPENNQILAGRWWRGDEQGQNMASVEVGLAEELGFRLGDRLRFQIGGQSVEVRITSLRRVKWDSFQVNFFVVLPPGVLEGYPATWITSFYLSPEQKPLLAELARHYPSIVVWDVDALMTKVRKIMEQAVVAVEYIFLFTLAAGVVVLYAALQATQDERRFESALLRTLGASRRRVRNNLFAEFAMLGVFSGVLAAGSATLIGYFLAEYVFGFPHRWNLWVWLLGVGSGGMGVGLFGWLGTRSALSQPPWETLRKEGG